MPLRPITLVDEPRTMKSQLLAIPKRLAWKHLIERMLDRLLGHDFFIAYGHDDGSSFPKQLHEGLRTQRFSVFLDEAGGYHGGDPIDRGTERFAGNARRLIVVAGPHAVLSDWALKEVLNSQARGRVQIVIDDPQQTLENAPTDQVLKKLLPSRKWLKRMPNDSNLKDLILDLSAGFSQYRRETRFYLMMGGTAVTILAAALVAVWLGYQGSIAREQAKTQQLLALTGRLTTRVEAALRAKPPRREDALRLARKAAGDTIGGGLPVPNSTEQALRNAIVGSGGRPIACGPANPPLTEAPRQLGSEGPLAAAAKDGRLCIWNTADLSFVQTLEKPKVIARAIDSSRGAIWEVDRLGRVFLLDAAHWSEGYRLFATLSGFVEPSADDGRFVDDPETVITRSSVVQHDFAGHAVKVWALPDHVVDAVTAFTLAINSSRFDVFYKQDKILLDRRAEHKPGVSRRKKGSSDQPATPLCLLDLLSHFCALIPSQGYKARPQFATLDDSASHLALVVDGRLQLMTYKDKWNLDRSLTENSLLSPVLFAAFVAAGPRLFVADEGGEAVLWTASTNAIAKLPTSYAPLASSESVKLWTSANGRWLVINDTLRGVTGYRIGTTQAGEQRFFPLNLPLGVAVRTATVGGRLTVDAGRKQLAFGDSATDAILMEPSDDSLTVRTRHLAGHDAPVTDLAFVADGTRLLTLDNSGKARWWDTAAEQLTTLPIALPIDPEDREESADDGTL
jgi:type II secretory pathway pseudopilin PulG